MKGKAYDDLAPVGRAGFVPVLDLPVRTAALRPVNLIAFALLTLLRLAFGAALLFNRGLLDQAWPV
jgi:hypothetical protein